MAEAQELDFEAFSEEIDREIGRLKRTKEKGGLAVGNEVISTILPLIKKLARMVGEFAEGQEEWADEVDEQLEELHDGGGGEQGSYLLPEHHQLFAGIVSSFDMLLKAVLSAKETPQEMREKLKPAQAIVAEATKLLEELEPADDEEEEDDGEEDDDGDDAGDADG